MTTAGTPSSGWDQFIGLIRKWLEDLGVNAELFNELAGDEALPMQARTLAVAALVYLGLDREILPDKLRFIGLIDDMLVMIIALALIVPRIPEERREYYFTKYEAVRRIAEYERIVRQTLGVLWERLLRFVLGLTKRRFKGVSAEEAALSPALREDLFDQTMVRIANLDLDPATLDKGVKELPPPEKVIGLLTSGLSREQGSNRDEPND